MLITTEMGLARCDGARAVRALRDCGQALYKSSLPCRRWPRRRAPGPQLVDRWLRALDVDGRVTPSFGAPREQLRGPSNSSLPGRELRGFCRTETCCTRARRLRHLYAAHSGASRPPKQRPGLSVYADGVVRHSCPATGTRITSWASLRRRCTALP